MKCFIVVALIALVASSAIATPAISPEQKVKAQEHAKICIQITGADVENVKKLRSGDFSNKDEKTQCFAKCFFEKSGFMDDAGNIIESVIIEKLSVANDKTQVEALYNKCKGETGANACEKAFNMYKCVRSAVEL